MEFHDDLPMVNFEASKTLPMVGRADFVATTTPTMSNFEMTVMAAMAANAVMAASSTTMQVYFSLFFIYLIFSLLFYSSSPSNSCSLVASLP